MKHLRFKRLGLYLQPADADSESWLQKQPEFVWLKPVARYKSRSLSQNALMWKWYAEIADWWGETPDYVHRYCKLHFGVPILRAENERFRQLYDRFIKRSMNYQQKLSAMHMISVTSIMSMSQAKRYLDAIQRHFAENGLELTNPEDIKENK